MWFRRAYLKALPWAALVLPLWLLIGWGVFQAGGWAFLWVLFIAIPSVALGQLVLLLLVRSRPSVRATGIMSWRDAGAFALWHALTIAVGTFPQAGFGWLLAGAIAAFLVVFWLAIGQLFAEAGAGRRLDVRVGRVFPDDASADASTGTQRPAADAAGVYVIQESPNRG